MSQLQVDLNAPRRAMGYLSGPMSASRALDRVRHTFRALEVSHQLWEMGLLHYCPHANSPQIGTTDVAYETWMAMDLEVLRRCDWLLLIDGWNDSEGCKREFNVAMNLGIPVAFTLAEAKALAARHEGRSLMESPASESLV